MRLEKSISGNIEAFLGVDFFYFLEFGLKSAPESPITQFLLTNSPLIPTPSKHKKHNLVSVTKVFLSMFSYGTGRFFTNMDGIRVLGSIGIK